MEAHTNSVTLRVQISDSNSYHNEKKKVKISFAGELRSEYIKKCLESEFSGLAPFRVEYFDSSTGRFSKDLPVRSSSYQNNVMLVSLTRDSYPPNDSSKVLLIKGKEFDLSEGIQICGTMIRYSELGDSSLGTGGTSWDASVVLSKYLEKNKDLVEGKMVIELGSGVGIAGMSAAVLKASYTL